jgi:hypothetical protein
MHMQCPDCGGQLNLITRAESNRHLGDAICQSCFLDWWYVTGEWRPKPTPPEYAQEPSRLSEALKRYYRKVLLENARVH